MTTKRKVRTVDEGKRIGRMSVALGTHCGDAKRRLVETNHPMYMSHIEGYQELFRLLTTEISPEGPIYIGRDC